MWMAVCENGIHSIRLWPDKELAMLRMSKSFPLVSKEAGYKRVVSAGLLLQRPRVIVMGNKGKAGLPLGWFSFLVKRHWTANAKSPSLMCSGSGIWRTGSQAFEESVESPDFCRHEKAGSVPRVRQGQPKPCAVCCVLCWRLSRYSLALNKVSICQVISQSPGFCPSCVLSFWEDPGAWGDFHPG